MNRKKPELLLLQPAQDKDRLGTRPRHKSSIPKLNLPILAARAGTAYLPHPVGIFRGPGRSFGRGPGLGHYHVTDYYGYDSNMDGPA